MTASQYQQALKLYGEGVGFTQMSRILGVPSYLLMEAFSECDYV